MTNQEHRALEDAFLARRHDALCEDKNPLECDCSACPCKGLCNALCAAEMEMNLWTDIH